MQQQINRPTVILLELTVREKVAIDLFELFLAQMTRRTILEEPFVPGSNFLISELGVLAQIFKHFRLQLAALFAHRS